jgi:hypothetical protein
LHPWSHAPQWVESELVSTQVPPHSVCEGVHVSTHAPALHMNPVAHAVPHAPQLVGSELVSTHAFSHLVCSEAHEPASFAAGTIMPALAVPPGSM